MSVLEGGKQRRGESSEFAHVAVVHVSPFTRNPLPSSLMSSLMSLALFIIQVSGQNNCRHHHWPPR